VIKIPVEFKRSVFKSGESVRVTIPAPIAETLNIKHKDVLKIWLDDSRIIMVKTETNVKPA
jgi:bifunctional DNA-binding transcriptional regulator/antitoxin component of YhaV-PrlF toxin-antitoxin module